MFTTHNRMLAVVLLSLALLQVAALAQTNQVADEPDAIPSRITEVVVYPEQALVRRSAELVLAEGEHHLVYLLLPEEADDSSVQVDGRGAFLLRDITVRQVLPPKPASEKVNSLREKIDLTRNQVLQAQDRLARIDKEQKLLESIAEKVTSDNGKDSAGDLNPDNWIKMVQFFRSQLEVLDDGKRETDRKLVELNRSLQTLTEEWNDLGGRSTLRKRQVEIKIEVKKAGKLELNLSYRVKGPSWVPVYELRASSRDKTMTVLYQAMVRQNSGEDWHDVKLSLSTARPSQPSRHPDLGVWKLGFASPVAPVALAQVSDSLETRATENMMVQMYTTQPPASPVPVDSPVELPEMEMDTAAVTGSATAELFAISGRSSVPSDNQPKKVAIALHEFPAQFRYSTVPKLAASAYLKAKVSNESPYTFLPGKASVFLDQSFIANTEMARSAKGESFWTFLGVDEDVQVQYRNVHRVEGDKGTLRKKNLIRFESEVVLTNNKRQDIEIVVWDQIPLAGHEDIKVRLLTPEYKEDSEALKMNRDNQLEWYFLLKPGAKADIPLLFTVEYPQGRLLDLNL